MQIFRMFLIAQNFSCASIQVINTITIDHLNNIISSNFIFQAESVAKIEEQFDRTSKVVWWSDRANNIIVNPLYHAFYWKFLKRLVEKCLS